MLETCTLVIYNSPRGRGSHAYLKLRKPVLDALGLLPATKGKVRKIVGVDCRNGFILIKKLSGEVHDDLTVGEVQKQ